MPAPTLTQECLGWARTAGYRAEVDDNSTLVLWSAEPGISTSRYQIRVRARGRIELMQFDEGEVCRTILFVADIEVLERYLYGMFGDDIREELDLPFLTLPWAPEDLAIGYELGDVVRGYRTLSRAGGEPVAAAPDETLSLLTLVPLSHFLGIEPAALKRAFMDEGGAPLLSEGYYAQRQTGT